MKTWQKYLLYAVLAYLVIKTPEAAAAAVRKGFSEGGNALDGLSTFITALIGKLWIGRLAQRIVLFGKASRPVPFSQVKAGLSAFRRDVPGSFCI